MLVSHFYWRISDDVERSSSILQCVILYSLLRSLKDLFKNIFCERTVSVITSVEGCPRRGVKDVRTCPCIWSKSWNDSYNESGENKSEHDSKNLRPTTDTLLHP